MPRATVNTNDTEKHDLKSCPGGYVVLRRMTYGEKLQRQQMLAGMKIQGSDKKSDFAGELQLSSRAVTEFEFAKCIVDHNLENENGEPLNMGAPRTLDILDPRIGDEIGDLIDKMHEVDEGNSSGE